MIFFVVSITMSKKIFLLLSLQASLYADEPAKLDISDEVTRGPYLQLTTENSTIIRWRTDDREDSVVRFGVKMDELTSYAKIIDNTRKHEVLLSDLKPSQKYYYSIGSKDERFTPSEEQFHFVTAPPIGEYKPTRIWVLGDSGTGNSKARQVMDSYIEVTKDKPTDFTLMLGDNAYKHASDREFQEKLFDIYPEMLIKTSLWSAVGNHDVETDDGEPYYEVFNFPMKAEAGGVASGTEAYFSFDYGNIHIVSLDSQTEDRSQDAEMLTWLKKDLAENKQKWIIACWHHSPYTKGSHDSDAKIRHIEMREQALPILEAAGVDLVLGGHSHCYERSYFINGFYDTPTVSAGKFIDKGDGNPEGDGAYKKEAGSVNSGTVYMVVGSSGHATKWTDGSQEEVNPNPHVVMAKSLLVMGSLCVDTDENTMTTRFIDREGVVRDAFVIEKK